MTQSFLQAPMIGDAGFVQPQQYGDTIASNTQAFQQDMTRYYSQIIEQENSRAVEKDNLTSKVLSFLGKEGPQFLAQERNRIETDKRFNSGFAFGTGVTEKDTRDLAAQSLERSIGLARKGMLLRLHNPDGIDLDALRLRVDNGKEDQISEDVYNQIAHLADTQDPGQVTEEMMLNGIKEYPSWIATAQRPDNGLRVWICHGEKCSAKTWNEVNEPGSPTWFSDTKAWMQGANRIFLRPYQGTFEDGFTDHTLIKSIMLPAMNKHWADLKVQAAVEFRETNKTATASQDFNRVNLAVGTALSQSTDSQKSSNYGALAITNFAKGAGMRYGGGNAAIEWLRQKIITTGQSGGLDNTTIQGYRSALNGKFIGNDGQLHSLGASTVNGRDKQGYWKSIEGLEAALTQAEQRNLKVKEAQKSNDRTQHLVLGDTMVGELTKANNGVAPEVPELMQIANGTHPRSAEFGMEGGWPASWGNQELVNWINRNSASERDANSQKTLNDFKIRKFGGLEQNDLKGLNPNDIQNYSKHLRTNPVIPDQGWVKDMIRRKVTTFLGTSGLPTQGDQFTFTYDNALVAFNDSVSASVVAGQTDKELVKQTALDVVTKGLGTPAQPGEFVVPTDNNGLVQHNLNEAQLSSISERDQGLNLDWNSIQDNGRSIITSKILPGTPISVKTELLNSGRRDIVTDNVRGYYQALAKLATKPGDKVPLNWWAIANAQYRLVRVENGLTLNPEEAEDNDVVSISSPMSNWEGLSTVNNYTKVVNPHNTQAMTLALVNDTKVDGVQPAPWLTENLKLANAESNGGYDAFTYGSNASSFGEGFFNSTKALRPYAQDYDLYSMTNIAKQPISSLTLGEIVAGQKENLLGQVGIYGFNNEQLLMAIEGTKLPLDTVFNKEIQEQLILGLQRESVNQNVKATVGEEVSWLDLLVPVDEYVALEQNIPWANRRENLIPAIHGLAVANLVQSQSPV